MTVLHQRRQLGLRSLDLPSPTITSGLTGTVIAGFGDPTATGLLDNSALGSDPTSTPDLPVATSGIVPPLSAGGDSSSPTPTASSSSSGDASIGTLIAACVGAAVGLLLVILIAIWYSRRLSRQSKKPGRPNTNKRRSSWGNLSEEYTDDKLGGMPRPQHPRQPSTSLAKRASLGSVAKLGAMFHRSPSITSCEKSSEGHGAESVGTMHHFAQYHPGLAQELAGASSSAAHSGAPSPPPIVRTRDGPSTGALPAMSWEGSNTVTSDSFLSLSGNHFDLSPVTSMAKSTPPVSSVGSAHYWESAEVIHPETASIEPHLQNPFDDAASTSMSMSTATSATPIIKSGGGRNPFIFGAQDRHVANPFSDAYSTSASTTTISTSVPEPDSPRAPEPAATRDSGAVVAAHHTGASRDHAMQSLLAALDIPESEVRDRLRIASMQSGISGVSFVSEDGGASVSGFPLPPTQVPRG